MMNALAHVLESPSVAAVILTLYLAGVAGLVLYGVGQGHLLWLYLRRPARGAAPPLPLDRTTWPVVTVQVPMYNERYVAAGVIDACAQLEWPRDRFELQILDDSVDDTVAIVDERAAYWRSQGVTVEVVRRSDRVGYKAGALAEGTPRVRGAFAALFDADFRPTPDFLLRTMGWFADEGVGAVQGRWGHLNRSMSWLTRGQALVLDAFFVVEQEARDRAGCPIRFNGSAGIWRVATVADAGGWQADTLSEDYDLCLRAQMRGWRMVYARDVVAPAELPVTMHDYKVQQRRWARGRGQVIRKHLVALWRSPLPPLAKAHTIFDLLNILVVPSVVLIGVMSPWLLVGTPPLPARHDWWWVTDLLQRPFQALVLPTFLWLALRSYGGRLRGQVADACRSVPAFLLLITGINAVITEAGLLGITGRAAPFQRTSKYEQVAMRGGWQQSRYRPATVGANTWIDGALGAYGAAACVLDAWMGAWYWLPFHLFFSLGFLAVFFYSVRRS